MADGVEERTTSQKRDSSADELRPWVSLPTLQVHHGQAPDHLCVGPSPDFRALMSDPWFPVSKTVFPGVSFQPLLEMSRDRAVMLVCGDELQGVLHARGHNTPHSLGARTSS